MATVKTNTSKCMKNNPLVLFLFPATHVAPDSESLTNNQ